MITILGPTAAGKTSLATKLALYLDAEIISADSRQVFRGMDIGTGKDLADYTVDGNKIPYHLIDICDAGEEYNVYRFVQDFTKAAGDIVERGKEIILCGGTGMYLESVLRGYNLVSVPENQQLRDELALKTMEDLTLMLKSLGPVHATSDLKTRERITIALEKRLFYKENNIPELKEGLNSVVIGLSFNRQQQRDMITQRLHERLNQGMIDEIKMLIDRGVNIEQLLAYGLEYKWVTLYLSGKTSYEDMVMNLNTAIHRFGKRQMTWFRRMEKNGIKIHWIDAALPMDEKFNILLEILNKRKI